MPKLIYTAICSLDGYTEDAGGKFDWAEPDPEVHAFVNDHERPVGTHLYGRRMYEVMKVWETDPALAEGSPVYRDYAEIWQAADKIVYSRTLDEVATAKTRIERDFDPAAVRRMKEASASDLGIGGPELAAHAFRAGLVDQCDLFLAPVTVGGGKRALPDGVFLRLELIDQRRFASGFVYVSYRTNP